MTTCACVGSLLLGLFSVWFSLIPSSYSLCHITHGKGWEIPVFLGGREERFDLTLDGTKTYLSTDGCGPG
jgi:hypothetical protein